MPAMSLPNGRRLVARLGNVDENHRWKLYGLQPGVYFWSVQSIDGEFIGSSFATEASFTVGGACPVSLTGDVDYTAAITAGDIIYLVNYVFKGGPAPLPCAAAGDVNCDGKIVSADVIGLVNYVFKSGPSPCDVCLQIPALWICP